MQIEKTLNEIKAKIEFENEEEKKTFDDYYFARGLGTYYVGINALIEYTVRERVKYDEFSSFIRYDKSLRDILYKYFGAFEEQLKHKVFSTIEYKGKKKSKKNY